MYGQNPAGGRRFVGDGLRAMSGFIAGLVGGAIGGAVSVAVSRNDSVVDAELSEDAHVAALHLPDELGNTGDADFDVA